MPDAAGQQFFTGRPVRLILIWRSGMGLPLAVSTKAPDCREKWLSYFFLKEPLVTSKQNLIQLKMEDTNVC